MRIPPMRVLVAALTLLSMGVTPLSAAADSASPDAALEFIKFLADPSKQAQWKTTGFESIGKTN
jgi:ABC-type glycerol-3-phosphate transport system substrate-binding protein